MTHSNTYIHKQQLPTHTSTSDVVEARATAAKLVSEVGTYSGAILTALTKGEIIVGSFCPRRSPSATESVHQFLWLKHSTVDSSIVVITRIAYNISEETPILPPKNNKLG